MLIHELANNDKLFRLWKFHIQSFNPRKASVKIVYNEGYNVANFRRLRVGEVITFKLHFYQNENFLYWGDACSFNRSCYVD